MRSLLYISGGIIIAALTLLYAVYDPEMYNLFPQCPFHTLFKIDCPGCGSQRAVHSLLNGHLFEAINYNLLLVLSLPLLAAHFYCKLATLLFRQEKKLNFLYYPVTPRIIFALVMVFWIVRNIPVYPFNFLAA